MRCQKKTSRGLLFLNKIMNAIFIDRESDAQYDKDMRNTKREV